MGQHDHWQPGNTLFYFLTKMGGIHIINIGHGDDQINFSFAHCFQGLTSGIHPLQTGRMREVHALILVNYSGGKAPFFFHDKGIIGAGYQQNLTNFRLHQFVIHVKIASNFFHTSCSSSGMMERGRKDKSTSLAALSPA